MNKVVSFFGVVATLIFALSSQGMPEKFIEVSPGIYRSAQPSRADLNDLKSFGIKTILNLNNDDKSMAKEFKTAKKLGINLIEHPMSGFWNPNEQQVDSSLELLQDPNNYPILVHCKHGEDRTGLIIGLHRVYADGWTPEAAYQEMLDLGFHPVLYYLDHYFKVVTGLED